jgi:hypothetical protein
LLDPGGSRAPEGDHLGPLRSYIRGHYHWVTTFPNHEQVWEKNASASQARQQGAGTRHG